MTILERNDLTDELSLRALRGAAHPLVGLADDYDPPLCFIGDERFVLLDEELHGTHEFHRERAQITKRLIREKGFRVLAIEADLPDAYRVNRYVRGRGDDEAVDALAGFRRFPNWMWRNADVLVFVGWLRTYNDEYANGQARWASTVWISTAYTPRSRQCSSTWTGSTPVQPRGPGPATPASTSMVRIHRPNVSPPAWGLGHPAS